MQISMTKEELNKIVSKHYGCNVEEVIIENASNDGWISNIGHNRPHHPETLNAHTKIEVKFRYGGMVTGIANDWDSSWEETDRHSRDIIAYRILKG